MSEYEVLQVQAQPQVMQIDALERANVDTQVATAKKYPRDMRRSLDDSIVMATLDKETAQSCGYALPRGNKPITGPSVHLAKIIVSNWGNMRTEATHRRLSLVDSGAEPIDRQLRDLRNVDWRFGELLGHGYRAFLEPSGKEPHETSSLGHTTAK